MQAGLSETLYQTVPANAPEIRPIVCFQRSEAYTTVQLPSKPRKMTSWFQLNYEQNP